MAFNPEVLDANLDKEEDQEGEYNSLYELSYDTRHDQDFLSDISKVSGRLV